MSASRVILRSGDEMFVTLAPDEVLSHVEPAGPYASEWLTLPLVSMELAPRSGHVRRSAVDAIETLGEQELEAHRRDREEWIAHGGD